MTEIPRVCCFECANDFENENPKNKRRMTPTKIRPINDVWNEYIMKGNPKSPPQNKLIIYNQYTYILRGYIDVHLYLCLYINTSVCIHIVIWDIYV